MKTFLLLFFSLFFLQSSAQTREDSLKFSEREIQNLVVFSKMYSALRYFYPSEKLSKIDWEKFLQEAIPLILEAKTDSGLTQILNAYCGSNDVVVSLSEVHPEITIRADGKIKYWKHEGFGATSDWTLRGIMKIFYRWFGPYRSKIVSGGKGDSHPSPDTFYSYRLSDAVWLHMRHTLYKKEKSPSEYRHLQQYFSEKKKDDWQDIKTENFRVATVIYIVGVLQNFFPYPEFVSQPWDSLLSEGLRNACKDTSNQQFLTSLRILSSALNDGHAGWFYSDDSVVFKPPLSFVLIDSSVVVKNCEQCDSLGVKIGDVLLKVDGEDALQVLKREERIWSAATPWDKTNSALSHSFLSGTKNSTVHLDFSGEKGLKQLPLKRTHLYVKVKSASNGLADEAILDSSILYLRLAGAKYKTVKKALSKITTEKGVILDNRGYPRQTGFFLAKLAKVEKMESQKWLVPIFKFPFQHQVEYDTSNWHIPRAKKTIPDSCKVVFLTNYKAISASETLMSIVKYYKVGTIIGETTAGTNGNIVGADYNETFKFIFTGMKVLNQDGSQFHGIGVVPDIEVKPTIEGIRTGRDEVLEYAIEYIKSGN